MDKYEQKMVFRLPDLSERSTKSTDFNTMVAELCQLNIKYLQQLLEDLNAHSMYPWSGTYHNMLVHSIELSIMEKTVLK